MLDIGKLTANGNDIQLAHTISAHTHKAQKEEKRKKVV